MVSCCHELGEGRIPEDGIVWEADVGDVEVDQLGAVVLRVPKVTGRRIRPRGLEELPLTPEDVLLGRSRSSGT